jgi:hypothetical protein
MKPINQRSLNVTLWVCQWTLAIAFNLIGMVKLGLTADHVRHYFGLAAETTTGMLHTVALVEVGVSLAVILPAVTRVLPQLSTVAAGGLATIALLGTAMPASAASAGVSGLNLALAAVAGFVVCGRIAIAPIAPLTDEVVDRAAINF